MTKSQELDLVDDRLAQAEESLRGTKEDGDLLQYNVDKAKQNYDDAQKDLPCRYLIL